MLRNKILTSSKTTSPGWIFSNLRFTSDYGGFYIGNQEITPKGVHFKSDGTKMYAVGATTDTVYEYNLSTAWIISTASYVQSFSVAGQEINPQGLFFKDDGTKMYVIGSTGDDVNEYTLSSAWDISTASYVQVFSVSTRDSTPTDIFFKSDGTKMYVVGASNDSVYEFTLSTPWDISTASYVQSFSVSAQETTPNGLFFKDDGTKMYITGSGGDDVNEYTLSSAWDISTASYVQVFGVATSETNPEGLFFKPDGTKMYIIGSGADSVFSFTLSTPWNISTSTLDLPTENYFSVAAQETTPVGIFFKDDGTKMYVLGDSGNDVNEYTLSTPWDISTSSYVQVFSVSAQESVPRSIHFKDDGTKMYVMGTTGDDVNEYTLSTPWDISTASYVQVFSVAGQEDIPHGLFFKPDGTKMYVIGRTGDDVNEYTLSSAWDISTASYVQVFSVSAQEGTPSGLFFKPDGTKMYIMGLGGDKLYEYSLSTPWDISTTVYSTAFSVGLYDLNFYNIYIKSDGKKLYAVGVNSDAVWAFDF